MIRMKVYIDEELAPFEADTLAQALTSAQDHLASTGRCIVQVSLDETELIGEALQQQLASTQPVGQCKLELYTADPRQLAGEVLAQVITQLDEAQDAQTAAATAFQEDRTTQGLEEVGKAMAVWIQTQQAVTHCCAMVQLNLDDRIFEGQAVTVHIHQLAEQIKQLRDLLMQRDTIGLADTLAYEWPETAQRWQRLVGQVILWIQS